ncbi:SH3 domain protein [Cordyceps fumosorosea ARSEF 2679]|uniref:SH3 domain protein n=1 Tax=Cordyceps fumosorosea (strain ARSEF 2679) TaxID=1081104 RepID=A0A168BT79_CORFA|nr:SH3 domain protein [Cordyceps fumosorosea ARSEF 2679]OAA70518.1 SH3 domain protein [Cordyceps fumosorosea ARSEF 2679]
MPVATTEAPAVALSFANNFWGKDDAGVHPLLDRMAAAKQTNDELKSFYSARASLEDEYAKKLLNLSRKALGSQETGSLKASLDTLRGEVESMGKQHQSIAAQMKTELEEPLSAFAGGMKERRKIVQNVIEKILKTKIQQTQQVNKIKTRDKYEQECLKIKGYLAQGHMVMGQEERRNKAKLEKTQISLATSNTEYETAIKALEETTVRWNREWKAAADKFQDLEEERLDFTKSSLWTFANISSTVCVSDDASCEKIRLSLESMEVEKDIASFITERGTGQEIPDAPKYINFRRGDMDNQSEISDDDRYSVAQFPRSINPAFRSSSPQPSTFESHHDPSSNLANDLAHRENLMQPQSRETTVTPQHGPPSQGRPSMDEQFRRGPPQMSPAQYDGKQHGPLAAVPHDPYPMDGMTMLCRTGPPSDMSSQVTSARPASMGSHSEYSNPNSFSSVEPPSGKTSPIKQDPEPIATPEKRVFKKKSGFFQNHSPFRRKSTKEVHPETGRNTWHSNAASGSPRRPPLYSQEEQSRHAAAARAPSPEPIDANASLALGVGQNVLPVSTSDTRRRGSHAPTASVDDTDPIAAALAELRVGGNKAGSVRMSADRYHGVATPAPSNHDMPAATRGTPPAYSSQSQVSRLGVPPPAVTSKAMKQASKKVASQTRSIFGEDSRESGMSPSSRPGTRSGYDMPRAASPAPTRSASPQPRMGHDTRYRSASPNPRTQHQRGGSQPHNDPYRHASPHGSMRGSVRGSSPASYADYGARPHSSYGGSDMAVQLAPVGGDMYGSKRGRGGDSRAMGLYEGGSRPRSKSVVDSSRQYTRDGRVILHFARALYMYQAAIPEELGFAKGDVLAVLRHQDDGWWEAEVHGGNGRQETLRDAVRALTSKPMQRAVVNAILLASGIGTLLALAAISSALFFQAYLPHQVVTAPVHLQYGSSPNPYGIAPLVASRMKSLQDYDISVTFMMPRSPANLDRGNFMVSLHLIDSRDQTPIAARADEFARGHAGFGVSKVLFSSRRSALVPYEDPLVSLTSRVLLMGYLLLSSNSQRHELTVKLAERVSFEKDSLRPAAAYVEVEAGQDIQIYSTHLTLTAQLRGLRYLMVHYRLLTYVVLTLLFWFFEVLFMSAAWSAWSSYVSMPVDGGKLQRGVSGDRDAATDSGDDLELEGGRGRADDEDEAGPSRSVKRDSSSSFKREPGFKGEETPERSLADIPLVGAEADDEDDTEEEDRKCQAVSGQGTSYRKEGSDTVRRRASQGFA